MVIDLNLDDVKSIIAKHFEDPFIWNKVSHVVMKKIERWHDRLE